MATLTPPSLLLLPPSANTSRSVHVSFSSSLISRPRRRRSPSPLTLSLSSRFHLPRFTPFAAAASSEEAEADVITSPQENLDDDATVENGTSDGGIVDAEEKTSSALMGTLHAYKEALVNGDEQTVNEIESFLQSIEDEKNALVTKLATLTEELSSEKDRVLRISADFDNFRKRTERERLSLMTNVQGEVVESLLPVLDNFERAKAQIKVETEGEEKINNSYQSIYKQFMETLTSLGVEALETVGNAFDPLLHEAIMREESSEYEEGIVLQEFRKGFKLGERLLRPSMVKVSSGPGPSSPEDDVVVPPVAETKEEPEQDSIDDDGDD